MNIKKPTKKRNLNAAEIDELRAAGRLHNDKVIVSSARVRKGATGDVLEWMELEDGEEVFKKNGKNVESWPG